MAGLAVVGLPIISSYTSSENEIKKVLNPRLILESQKNLGSQLSWYYSSFVQEDGKIKENSPVPFEKVNMQFGSYRIKRRDILCSPNQDGNYLLLRKKNSTTYTYEIEGDNQIQYKCPVSGFLQKNPSVKSIQLNSFKGQGSYGSNTSTDKIFVASCSFGLKKSSTGGKWNVIWDKCKDSEFGGSNIGRVTMSTNYETS